ncbi:MAG: hypothetical protein Unbinned3138contig1000_61 [Prokaryotic dsDNA virus sp.]|nr:MAG: hypothetical protein Unbinned3138contig1000_61 [Prokaryotic dsDNA virus sp.]|tara:strand:- start:831 stop:989 length:159 start_codon:yes stop_codon:yes gene_type:complete
MPHAPDEEQQMQEAISQGEAPDEPVLDDDEKDGVGISDAMGREQKRFGAAIW